MKTTPIHLSLILLCSALVVAPVDAQITALEIDSGASYYYTDHFEILIDRNVTEVWPHMLEMGSWLPWMTDSSSGSTRVAEGDRINLYDNFYIEVAKIIPEHMVLLVNMPTSQEAEDTQGLAMFTLQAVDSDSTVVSIFMSRIYFWFRETENSLRLEREAEDFAASRHNTFKDNFLTRLKQLAEE